VGVGVAADIDWRTEQRKLTDLAEWTKNPRQLSDRDAEEIKRSIARFGLADPLVVNADNQIIGGHQRKRIMLLMEHYGHDALVDVRIPSRQLTDREAEELAIRLNRNSGDWNFDTLANEFDLDDLLDWGFTEHDFELAGVDFGEEPAEDPGPQLDKAAELQEKWQVQRGQVWEVGRHRVMCGDSKCAEDVERLMGNVQPDVALCDPPYGMRLDTNFKSMGQRSVKHAAVVGDNVDFDAASLVGVDSKEAFWFGADYYASSLGDTEHEGSWLVWDKRLDVSADRMYGSCFELIWSRCRRKRDILRHKWAGFFTGGEQREFLHPTEKPVSLYVDLMDRAEGSGVYDPCGGIGTTLVACEQTGRIGYGMEIEPKYVAVTLQRLADMGLEPRLISE